MNTQMGSTLPTTKIDRNNFASWQQKYLVGYWSYIDEAQENQSVKSRGRDSVQRIRYDCACVYVCEKERKKDILTSSKANIRP